MSKKNMKRNRHCRLHGSAEKGIQLMDESNQMFIFVNEFVNQIANMQKGLRNMRNYYVFSDGDVKEKFLADAKSWSEYEKLRRGQ